MVIALLLGILTGLGVGGGSLLILWLTLTGTDPVTARSISLLFFFPAAVLSLILKRKDIPWRTVVPGAIAGCLTAWVGSRLAELADPVFFRKALGGILLIIGVHELCFRGKNK